MAATPSLLRDMPVGWLRGSFGNGRFVGILDQTTWGAKHVETQKLVTQVAPAQRTKRFLVLSVRDADHNRTDRDYTVSANPTQIRGFGFDSYDGAEDRYEQLAKSDCGKSGVKRGSQGLKHIGNED